MHFSIGINILHCAMQNITGLFYTYSYKIFITNNVFLVAREYDFNVVISYCDLTGQLQHFILVKHLTGAKERIRRFRDELFMI